jgi:HTH-type transcriptional regulator/antitoxin MqsA
MENTHELCPVCGEGHLHAEVGSNTVEYKGRTAQLPLHFSVCDVCGCEQGSTTELRDNKRAMLAFKKTVDGLLTGAEIRALRDQLGITQSQAAVIFGGGPVAFAKYEADDVMQSEAMDNLLRLARDVPEARAYLLAKAGIESISDSDQFEWIPAQAEEPKPSSGRPHLRVVKTNVFDDEPENLFRKAS